ncbi:hypothetical protein GH714_025483 [Hevea brasiliensis]|uniref:Uncharacterized protein n=1 Tax=Hevea brasiliensis TaxID=3981 RepID=A0A6A6KUC3_HEVBR|nr:hypothetical protein GH714_025483 [Hevea brasiliensis]
MARFIFENLPLLISLVLFILLHSSLKVATDSTQEANALLKWAATLHNLKDSNISSWPLLQNATNSIPRTSPCNWVGLSCNRNGRIERLNLTNADLNAFQTHLSDLSYNLLSGTIPQEIGFLTNLDTLHLAANKLNGSIPSTIGQLGSLTELALYTNSLDGLIPPSMGNLTKMVRLFLYENQLSGLIPPEIGKLTNLVEIYMDSNSLSGPIPSSFGNLTNLTVLFLFRNQLSSSIPQEIGNLKSLNSLSLYRNSFLAQFRQH